MEIRYRDKKVRLLCESRDAAVKKLGDACARKLRARLDDLEHAANVYELPAGNPHPLTGDRAGIIDAMNSRLR